MHPYTPPPQQAVPSLTPPTYLFVVGPQPAAVHPYPAVPPVEPAPPAQAVVDRGQLVAIPGLDPARYRCKFVPYPATRPWRFVPRDRNTGELRFPTATETPDGTLRFFYCGGAFSTDAHVVMEALRCPSDGTPRISLDTGCDFILGGISRERQIVSPDLVLFVVEEMLLAAQTEWQRITLTPVADKDETILRVVVYAPEFAAESETQLCVRRAEFLRRTPRVIVDDVGLVLIWEPRSDAVESNDPKPPEPPTGCAHLWPKARPNAFSAAALQDLQGHVVAREWQAPEGFQIRRAFADPGSLPPRRALRYFSNFDPQIHREVRLADLTDTTTPASVIFRWVPVRDHYAHVDPGLLERVWRFVEHRWFPRGAPRQGALDDFNSNVRKAFRGCVPPSVNNRELLVAPCQVWISCESVVFSRSPAEEFWLNFITTKAIKSDSTQSSHSRLLSALVEASTRDDEVPDAA